MNDSVWLILDDRPGNSNQVVGVANHLDQPSKTIHVKYTELSRLPNTLLRSSLLGIAEETRQEIVGPWPRIVISAGRRTAPLALHIKKQSLGYTKVVHIMWPDLPAHRFDLLILPRHDVEFRHRPLTHYIHVTDGAPNWVTPHILETAQKEWSNYFKDFQHPIISVFIGGATKKRDFGIEEAKQLSENLQQLQKAQNASLLISTSRRTNSDVISYLKEALPKNTYIHDFTSNATNPYRGMLALADTLVVTGDSISMCSEACTTGKPVYIFAPEDYLGKKHQIFVNNLFKNKKASPLGQQNQTQSYTPLDDAAHVASRIKELFL